MPLDQGRARHAPVKVRVPSDPGRLGLAGPRLTAGWTATANGIAHPFAARAPISRAPENRPGQGSRLSKTRYPVAAWPHNDGRAPARPSMRCLPAGTDASSQPSAADLLSRVTRENAPFPGSGALAPPTAAAGFLLLAGWGTQLSTEIRLPQRWMAIAGSSSPGWPGSWRCADQPEPNHHPRRDARCPEQEPAQAFWT
jgi:hypothetical protein